MEGFRGIWETQTLWAKHFHGLNDSTEIFHLKIELKKILVPQIKKVIKQRRVELKKAIREFGGRVALAEHEASAIIDAMFEPMFGGPGREPTFTPYITSFCSHLSDANQNARLSLPAL
jgi:hypothetical protein